MTVLVSVAMVTGVSACSGEAPAATPTTATVSATLVAPPTARPSGPTSTAAPTAGPVLPGKTVASQFYDGLREAGSYRLTTQTPLGGALQQVPYDVVLTSSGTRVRCVLQPEESAPAIEVVSDGRTTYAKSASFGSSKWFPVTRKSRNRAVANLASGVTATLAVSDPRALRTALAAGGTFRNAGTEDVQGVSTVKYQGRLPASVFAKLLPGMGGLVRSAAPATVWFDEAWVPRQVRLDVVAGGVSVQYTQMFSSFGATRVTMPAARDVAR